MTEDPYGAYYAAALAAMRAEEQAAADEAEYLKFYPASNNPKDNN